MAKTVLVNRIIAFGGRRISKDSNSLGFDPSRAEVPNDDFETLSDQCLPGAYNTAMMLKGGTSNELELYLLPQLAERAAPIKPFTVCMNEFGPVGSRAAFIRAKLTNFKWSGDFGKRREFELKVVPDSVFAWGFVLFNSFGTDGISAAVTGAGLNLGALTAGNELVVSYHVLDPPGVVGTTPTLDGRLESGASGAFSSPVNRLTLPQMTEPDGVFLRIDGNTTPISDAFWRPHFTAVGGTGTPTFSVLMAIAIQPK